MQLDNDKNAPRKIILTHGSMYCIPQGQGRITFETSSHSLNFRFQSHVKVNGVENVRSNVCSLVI